MFGTADRQRHTAELRDPVKRGGKEPSYWLARFLSFFIFFKDFFQEFCCSVLHTSLGGEGREGMFYLCESKNRRKKIERVG